MHGGLCLTNYYISVSGRATLQNWSLILYGTKKFPSDIPEISAPIKTPKSKSSSPKKIKSPKKSKGKMSLKPSPASTRAPKTKPKIEFATIHLTTRPKKKLQKSKVTVQETTVSPCVYLNVKSNVTKTLPNSEKTTEIVLSRFDNISKIPPVYQKCPKFEHVYPEIFPSRDIVKYQDGFVSQKQKEISRDLNPSRNVKYVKSTVEITTPVDLPTQSTKKSTAGNSIQPAIICMQRVLIDDR